MDILTGHTDPESAFLIDDYPYGFRLRCQMRVWVETKPKLGQRVWRQTSNPKRPGTWNKPKASGYSPIVMLRRNDDGHVETFAPNIYDAEAMIAFEEAHREHMDNYQRNTLAYLIAGRRAMKRVTFSVHSCSGPCNDPIHDKSHAERQKEASALVGALVRDELRKESNAALAGEPFDRA